MADRDRILQDIMREHRMTGAVVTNLQSGLFNDSFVLTWPEGQTWRGVADNKVVVRVAPPDDRGALFYEYRMMRREPDIHRVVREQTHIPVPDIYVFDPSRSTVDRDYMIMQWMPGVPISEAQLSDKSLARAHTQTGQYLGTLHRQVLADSFGYPGAHSCMSPESDWLEAFGVMWRKLGEDIHACGVYTPGELQDVLSAFEVHASVLKYDAPASLLHMDIWSQNILVDGQGNVTAILDWDRALWGDPGIEFAVLEYCGFDTEAFWRGYGHAPAADAGTRIRRVFYHLYEVQKYLVIWSLRRKGRDDDIDRYKTYCLATLKGLGQ